MLHDKKLSEECQSVENHKVFLTDAPNIGDNKDSCSETDSVEPASHPGDSSHVRILNPSNDINNEAQNNKNNNERSDSDHTLFSNLSDDSVKTGDGSVSAEIMRDVACERVFNDVQDVGTANINLSCDNNLMNHTESNTSVEALSALSNECLSNSSEIAIPIEIDGEANYFHIDKVLASDNTEDSQKTRTYLNLEEIEARYAHVSISTNIKQPDHLAPARKTAKGGTVKSEKKFHLPGNYKKYDPADLLTEMLNILSGRMKSDMVEYLVKTERIIPFIDIRKPGNENSISEAEFKKLVKDVNVDDHHRVRKIVDRLKLSDTDIFKAIKDIEQEETPKMSEMNSREFSYETSEANHNLDYIDISNGVPENLIETKVEGLTDVAKVHFNQDSNRADIVRAAMIIHSRGNISSSMVCTDTGANISLEGLDRYLQRGGRREDIIPAKIMLINASERSDQRILGYVDMKFYTFQDDCLIFIMKERVFIIDGPLSELLLGTPAIKRMELVIKEATKLSFTGKVIDTMPDSRHKMGTKVNIYCHSNVWPHRKMIASSIAKQRGGDRPAHFKVKYQTLIMGPSHQTVRNNEDLVFYESGFETTQNKELIKNNLMIEDLWITITLSCLNTNISPSKKSKFNFVNLNSDGKGQRIEEKAHFATYGTLTRGPYDPKRKNSKFGHEEVHDDIITTGPVAISADERLKLKEKVNEDDNLQHLDDKTKSAIKKIHATYPKAFATEERVVGEFTAKEFEIRTVNNDGPQIKQFPLPKDKMHILETEIAKLEKHGVFEKLEKRSKYNSPVFPVGKQAGKDSIADRADNMKREFKKHRVVFDARSLNSMTIGGGNCSLPTLDSVLSSIESKHVIICDLKNAFWALKYDKATKEKLAIMVNNQPYTHGRILMGGKESMLFLMEALGITFNEDDFEEFKKLPENACIGETLLHECFIAYVDDILIFHINKDALIRVYAFVLQQCCKFGWLIEESKVSIMRDSFELLGSSFERLSDGKLGYFIKKDRSSNMMKFPVPNTKRSLASRMSTISYYDRFLPGHKVITAVLFAFLKSEDNTFTHLLHRVWAMLMLLIRLDLCLAVPEKDKPILILLDSSLSSCSSYLCQLYRGKDGKLHIKLIKATSKVFGNSMIRASSIHKEMYNFVSALKSGEDILRANNAGIVAITDCLPLVYTLRSQHTTNQFTVAGSWISSFPGMVYLHVNGSVLRSVDIHSRLFTNSFMMKRRFDKDMATTIPTDLFTTD